MMGETIKAYAPGGKETRERFAVAVYGGAFDPPHAGHASVIQRALELTEQLLLVPSFRHADGKRMAAFQLRCSWLERLAQRFDERVRVCSVEQELGRDGQVIYSVDLLQRLAHDHRLPNARLALLIGEDNLPRLAHFHRAGELRQQFGLLVASEQMTVHSSAIRAMIAAGKDIPPAWQLPEIQSELTIYGRDL